MRMNTPFTFNRMAAVEQLRSGYRLKLRNSMPVGNKQLSSEHEQQAASNKHGARSRVTDAEASSGSFSLSTVQADRRNKLINAINKAPAAVNRRSAESPDRPRLA